MIYELWHLPSHNMVGDWESAAEALKWIQAGLNGQGATVLEEHALLAVEEEEEEPTAVAEGPAILDALAVLKLIDEMHLTDTVARDSFGKLLGPILEQYRKLYGALDPIEEGWLQGFLAARLLSGSFEVKDNTLLIGEMPELRTNQLPELAKAS